MVVQRERRERAYPFIHPENRGRTIHPQTPLASSHHHTHTHNQIEHNILRAPSPRARGALLRLLLPSTRYPRSLTVRICACVRACVHLCVCMRIQKKEREGQTLTTNSHSHTQPRKPDARLNFALNCGTFVRQEEG